MATFDLLRNKPSTMAKRAKSTTDTSTLRKPAMIGQRSQSSATSTNTTAGMKVTPWGVALRPQTTKARRNTSPVNRENNHIAKRRSTLRKTTKDLAKCVPKKTGSRKFKLQAKPFAIHKEPMFGVVLKSVADKANSKQGEEAKQGEEGNFLDLQLKEASHRCNGSKSEDASQDGNGLKPVVGRATAATQRSDNPFGVRLKPIRSAYNRPKRAGSTFQIDLNPSTAKSLGGKYVPDSKNFLEIRLRPVKRTAKEIKDNKPEFIELQLRHIVAPVDGGPKRAVTQASFHIPLMKHIDLQDLRRKSISLAQAKAKDPLGDVLQLQIQNLKHCEAKIPNQSEEQDAQFLKINLRHVCPNTDKVTDMAQNIHVELKPTEYETTQLASTTAKPKKRSSWNVPPSMAVAVNDTDRTQLNPTEGSSDQEEAATPEEPKVFIKQDVHVVHEEEEDHSQKMQDNSQNSHSNNSEYDEEEVSDYEEEVLDDSEYEEEVLEDDKPKRTRFTNKGPRRAGSAPAKPTEDFFEIEEEEEYNPLPLERTSSASKRMTVPAMHMEKTMDQVRDEYEEEEQKLMAQEDADKKKKKKKRFRRKKKKTVSDDEYEYFEEVSDSEYEEVSGDESDGEYEEYEVTDSDSEYEEYEVEEEDPVTGKKTRTRRRVKREKPVKRSHGTPPKNDSDEEYEEYEEVEEVDPVTGKKKRFRRRIKRETPIKRADGTPPTDSENEEYEEYEVEEVDPVTGKKTRIRRRVKRETRAKRADGTPPIEATAGESSEEDQDPETTPEKAQKKKKASQVANEEPESEKPAVEDSTTTITKTEQGGTDGIITTNGRRTRPRTRPANQKKPPRSRSRSLTELDRLKSRRDTYLATHDSKPKEEKPKVDLTLQKRRDLLMWYNRMKCPNKEEMKRRVAKLPADCDISTDDVELLPWLMRGRFLDLKVMNSFFMENWQGKEGAKKK